MKTTVELIDELRRRRQLTDYGAAKALGVTRSTISNYRCRGIVMAPAVAHRLAELLEIDSAYVRAIVEAERAARDEQPAERAMWERIAQAFGKAAMLALFTAAPFMAPSPAQGAFNNNAIGPGPEYTLRRKGARKWCDS